MATRGRKKGAQPPKTAKERKAAFDSRMRNPDPSSPPKSRRTPGVYYLSEEAREVLKKHRTVRTLKVPAPSNDSDFLEKLILDYDAYSMSSGEWEIALTKIDRTQVHVLQVIKRLLKRIEELKRRRRELNSQIQVLEEQSTKNKDVFAAILPEIQKDEELKVEVFPTISDLVMAHEELPPLLWKIWVSRFDDALSFSESSPPDFVDVLRREIKDYIQSLNRGLHFQNQYTTYSNQDIGDDEAEKDYEE
jgi:hypothetical protein